MFCTAAAYDSFQIAKDARRDVLRETRYRATVNYCEKCDAFHLCEDSKWPFNPRWKEILKMVAQGHTSREIALYMPKMERGKLIPGRRLKQKGVEKNVRAMMKHFGALSRPHLVAIAICLGIINPNDFVPTVKEHH